MRSLPTSSTSSQRTTGFVLQSLFIGIGASLANALPYLLNKLGVSGNTASGIPLTVKYSFQVGAVVFLLAVLWTVVTTTEFPPEDMAAFERAKRNKLGIGALLSEIGVAISEMPKTMRQLAVVQLITWLGLFCMWLFFVPATARHVFGATDPRSALYASGMEWGGFAFAFYSITCFLVALALPRHREADEPEDRARIRAAVRRGRDYSRCGSSTTSTCCLLSMVGVGIAWASILSMPYAILSGALPANRMGVYMGVFNFFIVLPEIVASLGFGALSRTLFGANNPNAPLYLVTLGGACLAVAAVCVVFVDDRGGEASPADVIRAEQAQLLQLPEGAQAVP